MDKKYGFIFAALILGIALRLIWPLDMEWKADEILMYNMAADAIRSGNLAMLGMPSGGGIINAGFSAWPFALFYRIYSSPVFMGQCVQLVNIASVFIFIACILPITGKNKSILLAGLASWSVSILPVLFSRKIWAQDLLPFFIALMWFLYIHRDKLWTLFLLGIICAFAGQLHLSGFYYAAGLFLVAAFARQINMKQIFIFIGGGSIGLITAIPWIDAVLHSKESSFAPHNIFKFEFWLHGIIDPLGINVFYSLGNDTRLFAASFGYLPVLSVVLILGIFITAIIRQIRAGNLQISKPDFSDPLTFTLYTFVLVPGILLTFSGIPVRSHYLIGAYPFLHILFMRIIGILKTKWQIIFISAQAVICFLFLLFVHQKQVIDGEYGSTWRQTEMKK